MKKTDCYLETYGWMLFSLTNWGISRNIYVSLACASSVQHTMDSDLTGLVAYIESLRWLRHCNERACFVLSVIANVVLGTLVIRTKDEVLKPYNRILLITCAVDLLYSASCMFVEVVSVLQDYR